MAATYQPGLQISWSGKLKAAFAAHLLKSLVVGIGSGFLAGVFGFVMIASGWESGSARIFLMILPHALASTLVFTLFLAAIFSLEHYDP